MKHIFFCLVLLNVLSAEEVPLKKYINGDWHITTSISYSSMSLTVNGSVFFDKGGLLTLENSQIQLDCAFDRQFKYQWNGGTLNTISSTVGGIIVGGKSCRHVNHYLYDGIWFVDNTTVHCSYGILFSDSTVGGLYGTQLKGGVSPDSVIMQGKANVFLINSDYSFLLGFQAHPGTVTKLDLPINTPLVRVIQPAGVSWRLQLENTSCTHWFVSIGGIEMLKPNASIFRVQLSRDTAPFNCHLMSNPGLSGTYSVHSPITTPVTVGNIAVESEDTSAPVSTSAFEFYASTHSTDNLHYINLAQGGENMVFGQGSLTVTGTGRDTAKIACTTCNADEGGTLTVENATIGHLGGYLLALGQSTGTGKLVMNNVVLNDIVLRTEDKGTIKVSDCSAAGKITKEKEGGTITVGC